MSRLDAVRALFEGPQDAALVMTPYNRRYFSGFPSSAGVLAVGCSGAEFIVDFRYIEAAKKGVFPEINVSLQQELYPQLLQKLQEMGAKRVLLEQELSLGEYYELRENLPGLEFVTDRRLTSAAREARAIKEPGELESIKRSQAITDGAFKAILDFIKPGVSELEIAARLEYEMRCLGSEGPSFSTICVSGENTSKPHGVPGERRVQKGDFITMDFGSLKDGYCSDMTRTVAVGEVSERQKLVYNTVLKAHLAAMAAAKAGITGRELDAVARDIIYSAGFEGCFGHGLGHSLGLEIHETPTANQRWEGPLAAGTIMTIEPAIYLEGEFGVRIENMVYITDTGCIDLTASPRELIQL